MKFRQKLLMFLIASGAGLALATAFAQPTDSGGQPSERFRSLDKNGDGYIGRHEVSHLAGFGKAFDEADENHDGKLSPDEFIKADSIYGRQKIGAYVDDSALTAKVKAALARELELKSVDVHVETDKGRVLLSGWVQSDAERKKAFQVASRVEGVKQVKDAMVVR